MRLVIGVVGAGRLLGHADPWAALARLGRSIAEHDCTLLTGTCAGLPHALALGAKAAGGLVVGVSPAGSRYEHVVHHGCPVEGYDVMLYTGADPAERDLVIAQSADILVRAGDSAAPALIETAQALGRLVGVFGTAADIPLRCLPAPTGGASLGAEIIQATCPSCLIGRLVEYYHAEHARQLSTRYQGTTAQGRPSK